MPREEFLQLHVDLVYRLHGIVLVAQPFCLVCLVGLADQAELFYDDVVRLLPVMQVCRTVALPALH